MNKQRQKNTKPSKKEEITVTDVISDLNENIDGWFTDIVNESGPSSSLTDEEIAEIYEGLVSDCESSDVEKHYYQPPPIITNPRHPGFRARSAYPEFSFEDCAMLINKYNEYWRSNFPLEPIPVQRVVTAETVLNNYVIVYLRTRWNADDGEHFISCVRARADELLLLEQQFSELVVKK
jgi:hypothetical protein